VAGGDPEGRAEPPEAARRVTSDSFDSRGA
jgi:hypothetical protein